MSKRKWQDEVRGLHQELGEFLAARGPEFLWDTSIRLQLRWPSLQVAPGLDAYYFYIGREAAKALYEAVLRLRPGNVMQILGSKGSGKRTVMATVVAFLHAKRQPAVHISGHEFAFSPVSVLRQALILCYSGDKETPEAAELLDLDTLPELVDWCTYRSLLLVVDDWDKVETQEERRDSLMAARLGNTLIRISSINSRERHAWETSDKASDYIRTVEFDGPFTPAELRTWVSHAELSGARLEKLDYFTGGMPRLMRYYAEAEDDDKFMQRISRSLTNKIESELMEKLRDKEGLEAALELVTSHDGLPIPAALEGMKLTCFYKVGYHYRILSPYLRSVAEKMILDEASKLEKRLLVDDIQVWIAAIQTDLEADVGARNPARIGWNVEGLIIGAIRVQGQVLPEYPFAVYKTYARNKELEVLMSLKSDVLKHGVLLGPLSFNEKAVDLVYIILKEGILHVIALQISIAQWKTREGKKSDETWRKEVLPKWKPAGGVTVCSKFLYLMPAGVTLEDISNVEVKQFSEICSQLCFLDALTLEQPKPVQKSAKRSCAGTRKDGENCRNTSLCPDCKAEGYCQCEWFCQAH